MSFFEKRMKQYSTVTKENNINPIDLFYKELIQEKGYNFLRDTQTYFLNRWHDKRDDKDIVGILDTGAGKTLIGLLMLYSKLKEGIGPVVYLCADNQLVEQVCSQAALYGIPVCTIIRNEKKRQEFPIQYTNNEAVLVTTFERMFNGESIFGVRDAGTREIQNIGALVVDDAHECIKKAREKSTIKISREKNCELYNAILSLFEEELTKQGIGAYNSIKKGESSVIKQIPYWAWENKLSEIQKLLTRYNDESNPNIFFTYDLIIDVLDLSECFISGAWIEITPLKLPTSKIPSFEYAKHRYFLSATLNNSYELVSELDVSLDAVNNLVESPNASLGERLILAPKRYHSEITDVEIRDLCIEYSREYNVAVIVPSEGKAKFWLEIGGVLVNKDNISEKINILKATEKGNLFVFLNRYDGLDLIDNMCRVLVIDGMPNKESLKEQIEPRYRKNSEILNMKKAQILEQGLGRAVRSGTDHCVSILLGTDVLKFIGVNKNRELFSPVIQSQLDFGINLTDDENISKEQALLYMKEAMNECLSASDRWRHFHKDLVNESTESYQITNYSRFINISDKELKAIKAAERKDLQYVTVNMNELVEALKDSDDEGYYTQLYSHLLSQLDGNRSREMQVKAYDLNNSLIKPISFVKGRKVKKASNQISQFKERISLYEKGTDICIEIESIINNLIYSPMFDYKKFEEAVGMLGEFLGFHSSRPELDFDDGPDNLWRTENFDLVIECKNNSQNNISRAESNQMTNSINWYKEIYKEDKRLVPVMLHRSALLENNAHANGTFKVINAEKLDILKMNLGKLSVEMAGKSPNTWSNDELHSMLSRYHFTEAMFLNYYLKDLKSIYA